MNSRSTFSRRSVLKAAVLAASAGALSTATGKFAPAAHAAEVGPVLGTVIDFAAGVPSAASIKAAGHMGAVRYVSQRRPGAEWMLGKPVTLAETQADAAAGLAVASIYQFGKGDTADWLQGAAGAAAHAPQAIAIHRAAGGPTGRPIYIAIDDNPSRAQYDNQIKPYLQAFSVALRAAGYQVGVYGNYNVIEWASQDGIGSYYWMHDWGSGGKIHPRTTIHQLGNAQQQNLDGISVDINNVHARDWGQWVPGSNAAPAPAAAANPAPVTTSPAPAPQVSNGLDAISDLSSRVSGIPGLGNLPQVSNGGINVGGSSVSADQIRQGSELIKTLGAAIG